VPSNNLASNVTDTLLLHGGHRAGDADAAGSGVPLARDAAVVVNSGAVFTGSPVTP